VRPNTGYLAGCARLELLPDNPALSPQGLAHPSGATPRAEPLGTMVAPAASKQRAAAALPSADAADCHLRARAVATPEQPAVGSPLSLPLSEAAAVDEELHGNGSSGGSSRSSSSSSSCDPPGSSAGSSPRTAGVSSTPLGAPPAQVPGGGAVSAPMAIVAGSSGYGEGCSSSADVLDQAVVPSGTVSSMKQRLSRWEGCRHQPGQS
jgi:hypothetical protein